MVISFLRRVVGGRTTAGPSRRQPGRGTQPDFLPLSPSGPVCLLGDLHGRADLLERFLATRETHFPDARIIFLGDMIDRGPESAAVLKRVREEVVKGAVALAGNHEAMFLAFLDQPEQGRFWLKHGGFEMAASYGLDAGGLAAEDLRARILDAMGDEMLAWLRALPLIWQSGNLVAVHAGLDPGLPVAGQEAGVMQWGHRAFGQVPRQDGIWVAHGHTVTGRAFARAGRIALDTGAYATGRLSFAVVDPGLPEAERLMIAVTP